MQQLKLKRIVEEIPSVLKVIFGDEITLAQTILTFITSTCTSSAREGVDATVLRN